MSKLLEAIDSSIKGHNTNAKIFFQKIEELISIILFLSAIYIAPGVATKILQSIDNATLNSSLLTALKFISGISIDDQKIEVLIKFIIPALFGGYMGGVFIAYNFHAKSEKEFNLKKIEFLSSEATFKNKNQRGETNHELSAE